MQHEDDLRLFPGHTERFRTVAKSLSEMVGDDLLVVEQGGSFAPPFQK
jgi:hypothetical protein